jgi:hypothetical protein
MDFLIRKASGKREPFQEEKFKTSMRRIGADEQTITNILAEIRSHYPNIRSTRQLFRIARGYLSHTNPTLATRYNLKQALLQLGPTGFPLEKFIAEIFAHEGFTVITDQTVAGKCINHEIDVIAHLKDKKYMIESKFHNRQNLKSDVKVPLYIKARYDDIQQAWEQHAPNSREFTDIWIVTNTEFSSDAVQYAQCEHMHLMSWRYPQGKALRDLISKHNLHPITALLHLSGSKKRALLKNGFVLCRDIITHQKRLPELGLTPDEIERLVHDAQRLCSSST